MSAFATQVGHYQYIKRTVPATEWAPNTARIASFPRPLRAGLGWAVVFLGLLTKITLAHKAVGDFRDPVVKHSLERKQWESPAQTQEEL
jgi:hypothetical protein